MKKIAEKTVDDAIKLVEVSQDLDYKKIINHDPAEVKRLHQALAHLNIKVKPGDSIGDYASKQRSPGDFAANQGSPAENVSKQSSPKAGANIPLRDDSKDEKKAAERRKSMLQSMGQEGLDERVGNVYNSFVAGRSMIFNQAPHRKGLPKFDLVVAPDFSPKPGLHGIFVGAKEVMSIILPMDAKGQSEEWLIINHKAYKNEEEMIEYVTLLSAGFELPE